VFVVPHEFLWRVPFEALPIATNISASAQR